MARFSAAGRTVTNLPTAARGPGVFAGAAGGQLWLREIGVFNTTATAVAVGLAYCTATGTQAGALTSRQTDDASAPTPAETVFTSQSSDSTLSGAPFRQASLGAAIGSGMIWTFEEKEIEISEGTGNGVIVTCPTGTAQHLDFYIKWQK